MKVKIEYTVDIDKIPQEIERILYSCETDLIRATSLCSELSKKKEIKSSLFLKEVNKIREKLASIDFAFSDLSKIVFEYESYLCSQENNNNNDTTQAGISQPTDTEMVGDKKE